MFTHLHLHSSYSLLDSPIRLERLARRAKELGFSALALTDHHVLYGAVDFYELARAEGLHPIVGCEGGLAVERGFNLPAIFLCQNREGYRNLCHLVSLAQIEAKSGEPRMEWEWLERFRGGLFCLSTGIPTPTLHAYQSDRSPEKEWLGRLRDIFGENFYLEIQRTLGVEAKAKREALLTLKKKLSLPLVATEDVHLLHPEEDAVRSLLIAIQMQERNALKSVRNPSSLYLASPQEMQSAFSDLPEALQNTEVIAQNCLLELELNVPHLPSYPTPRGVSDQDLLRQKVLEGAKKKYGQSLPSQVVERMEYELEIVTKKGFASYFLIICDMVSFCREKEIPVGPGRGSAAGSLIGYCLGITQIEPLRYGLIFERFLNPERMSLPDIDLDVCDEQRQEVISYLVAKYGQDRVASIVTFGTMAARASVRDAGRALGVPLNEVDRIAKQIPPFSTLSESLASSPELREAAEGTPEHRHLLEMAATIEGLPRHTSTHAAGVVLSREPLMDLVPLLKGEEGQVLTQYSMQPLAKVGLLKMDILGLRNLSILGDAVALIRKRQKKTIDLRTLPLDDSETFDLLSRGETLGVFQMESEGMRSLLMRLHPEKLEDLIAVNALYRPGPLKSGMVDDFIQRRRGKKRVSYLHPSLEPILQPTYGVILYQEQVMEIAHQLAGFSMGEADDLRKAMGKKKPELLEKYRKPFLEGAKKHGISEKAARAIYELMEHFGGYGFNKSHSTAYALIAYQTAYLKAHYPLEFMTAILRSVEGNTEQSFKYAQECKRLSLSLLPPDVNLGEIHTSLEGDAVRVGLVAIKNVGKGAEVVVRERLARGPFSSPLDLFRRIQHSSVNKKFYESLILSGSVSSLHANRRELYQGLEKALEIASLQQKSQSAGQEALFATFSERSPFPKTEDYTPEEKQKFELEHMGIFFTPLSSPEAVNKLWKKGAVKLRRIASIFSRRELLVGGVVLQERRMKWHGVFYHTVLLSDGEGVVQVLIPESLRSDWEAQRGVAHIVAFKGRKLREVENGIALVEAEKVYSIAGMKKNHRSPSWLHLKVPREKVESLKMLQSYTSEQGEVEVMLHLGHNGGERRVRLGKRHRLLWNEEVKKVLGGLFGEEACWLETQPTEADS